MVYKLSAVSFCHCICFPLPLCLVKNYVHLLIFLHGTFLLFLLFYFSLLKSCDMIRTDISSSVALIGDLMAQNR
jgi:hypothetical protein